LQGVIPNSIWNPEGIHFSAGLSGHPTSSVGQAPDNDTGGVPGLSPVSGLVLSLLKERDKRLVITQYESAEKVEKMSSPL
jgi:hypothetical protein